LKSLLRYPGGKTRALKHIIPYFPKNLTEIVSPFFGGGSIEIHYASQGVRVHGYEIFEPLVNFWQQVLENPKRVADFLFDPKTGQPGTSYCYPCTPKKFKEFQRQQDSKQDDTRLQNWPEYRACMFYALNRSSFSGCTMSAGYSKQAAEKRFTLSSIERLRNFDCRQLTVKEMDFKDSLAEHDDDVFIYADPPYAIENPMLYGENGSTHKGFDHVGLAEVMKTKNNWVMSYNPSPFILDLYKDYEIVPLEWSYGMKNVYSQEEVAARNLIKDITTRVKEMAKTNTFEKDQAIVSDVLGLLDQTLQDMTKEMGKSDEILILNTKGKQ